MRAAPSAPADLVVAEFRAVASLAAVSLAAVSLVAVSSAADSRVVELRTAGFEACGAAMRAGRCASPVPARPDVPVEPPAPPAPLAPFRDDETGEGGRDREEGSAVRGGRPGDRDAPTS
ncbi:hypothetical protein [Microbispora bryophytorum]|uniref:Uncharacterized protein n=1 Tax=Microbispora bryophytorum subsp. camponoti TaxID=1677852 RepID=A0ABR8L015_9ACTN|nr:hypothetical protein [Microbispora camponoti]MBD3144336.1 hypothetical protein [Microbispora camponoti]